MPSWTLIQYVLTAARRDRVFLSLLLAVIVGASLSLFLGSAAVTEANQFALVFTAGGLRLAGVVGIVLFVVFFMRRSFDARDVDFLLSRPVSKAGFILSHAAAFSLLGLFVAALITAAVFAVDPASFVRSGPAWGLSLAVEMIIMANAAFFFSMVISSATSGAMAVLGLYVLARLIGEILGITRVGMDLPFYEGMTQLVNIISLIVPRLDLMAQTSWLVYGAEGVSLLFILAQGFVYSGLLIAAALIDLTRRQF